MLVSERKRYGAADLPKREPKCPPDDTYTLTFSRIVDLDFPEKGYKDQAPQLRFTLEFTLEYPYEEDPELVEKWGPFDGMKLNAWYTPIFEWKNRDYIQPKLNKLLMAMTNNEYEEPDQDDIEDFWAELEPFLGKKFRQRVGPNKNGFATLLDSPAPLVQMQRKLKATVIPATPADDADDVDEMPTGEAA